MKRGELVDEMIARQAIKGDEQAILQVLFEYEDVLYRTAFAYLKNEHDALDAMQELMYRTLKKIHTVKEPAYVSTWLMRVLLNICHDMKTKQQRTIYTEQLDIEVQQQSNLEIVDMVNQLPLREQEIIYLKYFQQLQNKEIAELQAIPEGTVKSRIHSALKSLRKIVKQEGDWR